VVNEARRMTGGFLPGAEWAVALSGAIGEP